MNTNTNTGSKFIFKFSLVDGPFVLPNNNIETTRNYYITNNLTLLYANYKTGIFVFDSLSISTGTTRNAII